MAKKRESALEVLNYSAVENVINGLGGTFSKSRAWVPRRTKGKRNYNRLNALYNETIGGAIVDLPVEGLVSAEPLFEGECDPSTYKYISGVLKGLWKRGRLYGYAWLDKNLNYCSITNSVPGGSQVVIAYGKETLLNDYLPAWQSYESVLVACYSDIVGYEATKASIAETVSEFALLSIGIPNFLASAKECSFVNSMQNMVAAKTVTGATTIDATAKLELVHYQYEGILKVLSSYEDCISASSGIPKAVLFQRSPQGATSGRFESARWIETLSSLKDQWIRDFNLVALHIGVNFRLIDLKFDNTMALYGAKGALRDPNGNATIK